VSFPAPTPRRNGQYMITVLARHHLGDDTLTQILAATAWREHTGHGQRPGTVLSRRTAERAVRIHLTSEGTGSLWLWNERVSDDEDEAAAAWT
jgi:hypothetical protein